MTTVTLQGNSVDIIGDLPAVGSAAPDFKLTAADLADKTLADYAGRKILMNIVPSLDTPTCAVSTRKFNESAAAMDNVSCLVISADLPFASSRFCSTEGLENVETLSLMRDKFFAKDYGALITTGVLQGLATRAVVVIDENGKVTYTQLVPEIADEPDYDAALAALK